MVLLFVLVSIAIIAAVAVLVVRDAPLMPDDPSPGRPLRWPPGGSIQPDDVGGVRFSIGLRGYRMDEVDRVLDDVRAALLERDQRIAELEPLVAVRAPEQPGDGRPGEGWRGDELPGGGQPRDERPDGQPGDGSSGAGPVAPASSAGQAASRIGRSPAAPEQEEPRA